MSLQFSYILVATLILIAEFIITFFIGRNAIDLISFKIIRRFSLLVLTQILFLLWENFLCEVRLFFPLWMLMFLFYGPYIYLFVCYNVNRKYCEVFAVYLLDFYFTICAFSFGVFILLFQNIIFKEIGDNLKYVFGFVVVLSLSFYWYRSFMLLQRHKFDFNCNIILSYKTKSLQLINILFVFISIVLTFLLLDNMTEIPVVYFCLLVLFLFHLYLNICKYHIIKGNFVNISTYNDNVNANIFSSEIFNDHLDSVKIAIDNVTIENAAQDRLEKKVPNYEKAQLSQAIIEQIDLQVTTIVIKKKAYLNSDFKMFDLARQTKVSRYYLAQYFQIVHKMNFREYINKLRIIHVLEFVRNYQKKSRQPLTTNQLFTESSFNSKTTFFKSFKVVTGCTPSEFIKKQV